MFRAKVCTKSNPAEQGVCTKCLECTAFQQESSLLGLEIVLAAARYLLNERDLLVNGGGFDAKNRVSGYSPGRESNAETRKGLDLSKRLDRTEGATVRGCRKSPEYALESVRTVTVDEEPRA